MAEEKKHPMKLTRRQFLVVGGQSAAALALLASCGGAKPAPGEGGGEGEPEAAPLTLEFLAWGDNADIPAWEEFKATYEEMNPNVTIKLTIVSDPGNNFYPKLQTMVAGGTPPDVSSFQGWEWQTYADKGLLAPVDDYIARDNFTDPYPEGVTSIEQSTVRNGKTYLIPLQIGTMVMFYAKKPFDEAGIDYPTDDWTMEEFIEIAKQLTDTSGDFKKFGLQANGSWFRDIAYIRGTGKQEFDTLIDPKKVQFAQPEIVDMLQLVAYDVYHTLKVSPTPADLEGGANTIETGNSAMKYEGPWYFPRLDSPELREEGKAVDFDVVMMPEAADPERPHRGWAEGVMLMKGDNEDAAWEFVRYIAGEEGDKRYSEITGRIPNSFKLLENYWLPMIKERFGVENGQAFVEAIKRSEVDVISGVPRSRMWSEVVKPYGYDPMMNASQTAAEALPKVDEELQKLLDEYWASQS
ncbi:MAG: ABC transporter substrate-binding protein [Anaerolineae bacterium]